MIQLEGLTKIYGDRAAVADLDLEVLKGELLVLLGGSGSGKTTTLKMINRLIEPTRGRVLLDGQDARRLAPHELRRQIGYCFQEVGLFPHLSVEQNVAITLDLLGTSGEEQRKRVHELLEVVDLDPRDFAARQPHELSGGQRQRVGLARALAAQPEVVLLDEPFGALDPLTRDRMQQFFRGIRQRLRFTSVFVTHDMLEALLLGDRIAVLQDGRLVQVGPPRELLARPASAYVEELMTSPRRQVSELERLMGAP